jgi:hypothetical protein
MLASIGQEIRRVCSQNSQGEHAKGRGGKVKSNTRGTRGKSYFGVIIYSLSNRRKK